MCVCVCVCVCVKWYNKRWSVHVCWMECNILTYNESVSCWVVSDFLRVYGLQPTRLLCPWDSPGKNTGVDCHFRFQGIFPIQRLNLISCSAGRFYTIWATRDAPYRKGVFLSAWYRVIGWFLGHALSLKVPGFWGEELLQQRSFSFSNCCDDPPDQRAQNALFFSNCTLVQFSSQSLNPSSLFSLSLFFMFGLLIMDRLWIP